MDSPVTLETQETKEGAVQKQEKSTTQEMDKSGVGGTPVKSTNQGVDESAVNTTPAKSTNQGVDESAVNATPAKSTTQEMDKSGVGATPAKSTNQGVDESVVNATPAKSTNQGVDESAVNTTPAKSATQGVNESGEDATPAKSTNRGVDESGVETPVMPTNQIKEGRSGVETPVNSTSQEVQETGVETPVTSAKRGVGESGVDTPVRPTDPKKEGSGEETPVTSTSQKAQGSGEDTPFMSTNPTVTDDSGAETPVTSTKQRVEESGVETPVMSAKEGEEESGVSTPGTSSNQNEEDRGVDTPPESRNQGLDESGIDTPATSAKKGVDGSGVRTPAMSTKQGMDGGGLETPAMSTNQAEKRSGAVEASTNHQRIERSETPLMSVNQGSGVETPATSTNQGNGVDTPGTSTNQGSGVETPGTSTNQGTGVDTPVTSTNQGSGVETPATSTNQGNGVETPAASTNQGSGVEIPGTSTNQGSGVETPGTSTNQWVAGSGVESPTTEPTAQCMEEHDTNTQDVPDTQSTGEQSKENAATESTLNTGNICATDEESPPKSLHSLNPTQLATTTTTTTTTTITGTTSEMPEENMSITAKPSKKTASGSDITMPSTGLNNGEAASATDSPTAENGPVLATSTEEKNVKEEDSVVLASAVRGAQSAVKVTDTATVSSTSAKTVVDTDKGVVSVSDAQVERVTDVESPLSENVSNLHDIVDPCVTSLPIPKKSPVEIDVKSDTKAPVAAAAVNPVSSTATTVTSADTSSVTSTVTATGTGSDTGDGNMDRPTTTKVPGIPKSSTSNVGQQQQRIEKERLYARATKSMMSERSTKPEVSPDKVSEKPRKQTTLCDPDNRTRKTLSSSSTSLHSMSRARRLKPATELLQESQRYRSGHSVYATRIMSRYLPCRSPQPGSPLLTSSWDRDSLADSKRVCRGGVPLRSPGSSGASSSLSLHRADSPTKAHSELMSRVAHKLSSSSGHSAKTRLGKQFSSCLTDFPTGDHSEGATHQVQEDDKTTPEGQTSLTEHSSASDSSKRLFSQGPMPEEGKKNQTIEHQHPVLQASLPDVDLERTEQRDDSRGKPTNDRASEGQVRNPASHHHSEASENTPPNWPDPTHDDRGRKGRNPSSNKQRADCDPSIPAVTSDPVSDHAKTVTPSTSSSSPTDVTAGQPEGKKKSRSRILNISWLHKPKKFFTASK
ncbi:hypothetical protein ACOMHN_057719 [Nucella lapillus]